jgi:hypothetical protein
MPPENTPPTVPENGTEPDSDTTDADAEAFANEWLEYKAKVDFIHNLFTSEPEKVHPYFRPLFNKKK